MSELDNEFDATQFEPRWGGGGQLPVGRYPVVIWNDEPRMNSKEGSGGRLCLYVRATEHAGELAGSSGIINLNIYHTDPKTKEIAWKQLSAICCAIGVYKVKNIGDLHGKPFVIEVMPQKGDDRYTEVVGVFDMLGKEPSRPQSLPQQTSGFGQQAAAPSASAFGGQPAQAAQAAQPAFGQQTAAPAAATAAAPPPWARKA